MFSILSIVSIYLIRNTNRKELSFRRNQNQLGRHFLRYPSRNTVLFECMQDWITSIIYIDSLSHEELSIEAAPFQIHNFHLYLLLLTPHPHHHHWQGQAGRPINLSSLCWEMLENFPANVLFCHCCGIFCLPSTPANHCDYYYQFIGVGCEEDAWTRA